MGCAGWCQNNFNNNGKEVTCGYGACSGCDTIGCCTKDDSGTTTTTEAPALPSCADKNCAGWCSNNADKNGNESACRLNACSGCSDLQCCSDEVVTPTTTEAPASCAGWCAGNANKNSWSSTCNFGACAGCADC